MVGIPGAGSSGLFITSPHPLSRAPTKVVEKGQGEGKALPLGHFGPLSMRKTGVGRRGKRLDKGNILKVN